MADERACATVPDAVESRESAQDNATHMGPRVTETPRSSPEGVRREPEPSAKRRGWLSRLLGVK